MTSTNGLTKSRTRYHLTITPLHKGVFSFYISLIYTFLNFTIFCHVFILTKRKAHPKMHFLQSFAFQDT